jgi:hypothetical protein
LRCGSDSQVVAEESRLKNRGAISLHITPRFLSFERFAAIPATLAVVATPGILVLGTADASEVGCSWMKEECKRVQNK